MARDENFNGLRRRCAVAIQDQQGKVELVHSIGYNAYEIVGCRATKAVGVMDVDGKNRIEKQLKHVLGGEMQWKSQSYCFLSCFQL